MVPAATEWSDTSVDRWTLREKCREADRLLRNFRSQLLTGLLPSLAELSNMTRSDSPFATADGGTLVRQQVAAALVQDCYTAQLYEDMERCLVAIAVDLESDRKLPESSDPLPEV